jgi:hypothetical protein
LRSANQEVPRRLLTPRKVTRDRMTNRDLTEIKKRFREDSLPAVHVEINVPS